MNEERTLKILLEPHLSEKATVSSHGYPQYIFKVAKNADKREIKSAVEKLFNVAVKKINVSNHKGANATKFGRNVGKHASFKKAYVVLESGNEISVI